MKKDRAEFELWRATAKDEIESSMQSANVGIIEIIEECWKDRPRYAHDANEADDAEEVANGELQEAWVNKMDEVETRENTRKDQATQETKKLRKAKDEFEIAKEVPPQVLDGEQPWRVLSLPEKMLLQNDDQMRARKKQSE